MAVVVGLGLLFGAQARAESADSLYKRGVELRRSGKDAEALEVFHKLDEAEKSPRAAAQMGLAEQALGMWVEAEGHIQRALEGKADPWIVKNHEALVRALGEIDARLGCVDVWGEPVGAEVLIDGKVVGTLPLPQPVRAVVGSVPITVRAPGYLERSTNISVVANQSARERFVLQPIPKSTPLAVPAAGSAGSPAPAVVVVAPLKPDAPPADSGKARRSAKWLAWAPGAFALGVGVFGAIRQNSAGNDFDSSCALDPAGVAQPRAGSNKSAADCAGLKDSVDTAFRIEVIALSGAAVLGATGLVLWLTEPDASEAKHARLDCVPALLSGRSPGLGCSWRF
jgi:hypothetical protein